MHIEAQTRACRAVGLVGDALFEAEGADGGFGEGSWGVVEEEDLVGGGEGGEDAVAGS